MASREFWLPEIISPIKIREKVNKLSKNKACSPSFCLLFLKRKKVLLISGNAALMPKNKPPADTSLIPYPPLEAGKDMALTVADCRKPNPAKRDDETNIRTHVKIWCCVLPVVLVLLILSMFRFSSFCSLLISLVTSCRINELWVFFNAASFFLLFAFTPIITKADKVPMYIKSVSAEKMEKWASPMTMVVELTVIPIIRNTTTSIMAMYDNKLSLKICFPTRFTSLFFLIGFFFILFFILWKANKIKIFVLAIMTRKTLLPIAPVIPIVESPNADCVTIPIISGMVVMMGSKIKVKIIPRFESFL